MLMGVPQYFNSDNSSFDGGRGSVQLSEVALNASDTGRRMECFLLRTPGGTSSAFSPQYAPFVEPSGEKRPVGCRVAVRRTDAESAHISEELRKLRSRRIFRLSSLPEIEVGTRRSCESLRSPCSVAWKVAVGVSLRRFQGTVVDG